jgi:hypothetical protein
MEPTHIQRLIITGEIFKPKRKENNMDIGSILIEKLTKKELHELCLQIDDGRFGQVYEMQLVPEDFENYPNYYTQGK